jgi:hypothetical protein
MKTMQPGKEFSSRLKTGKSWRNVAEPFIKEALKYCCPGREGDFARLNGEPYEAESEVFISIAEDMATDLAGDLINYYTPSEAKWGTFLVTIPIQEDQADAVLAKVQEREDDLFEMITSSNYNDIAPQWAFEASSHGTPGLWVQKAHLLQPIHCEVVPPHQIYVTPGHLGYLDRFREVRVLAFTLPALFDGWDVSLTDESISRKIEDPGSTVVVIWGFWINWDDPALPKWFCEITVDGKRVTPAKPLDLGPIAGSCPMMVGRFNPQVGKPWGRGPGWKALPDLRVMDDMAEIILSGLDQSLMNTIIYPDDGFLDLSEGLQAGRAYPAHRGFNREQIYDLSRNVNVDQGWFAEEKMEAKIARAFYQDGPRQRGDTPPTATQWLDERRRVQQRLGKPSAPLWSEFILPLIQRFEYLGVESGRLDAAITHNGQTISIMPISPLQKAQNQDQVMVSRSNLDLAFSVMGEGVNEVVDMRKTFRNIVKTSGDQLTEINDEQAPSQEQNAPNTAV